MLLPFIPLLLKIGVTLDEATGNNGGQNPVSFIYYDDIHYAIKPMPALLDGCHAHQCLLVREASVGLLMCLESNAWQMMDMSQQCHVAAKMAIVTLEWRGC